MSLNKVPIRQSAHATMSTTVTGILFSRLSRKKNLESELRDNSKSKLSRCLNTMDLTALGVGSTLGLGLYVLTGQIASEYSGPAVVLAWIIAAAASAFSGLCYAEFGARVPSAGSAYAYSYVTVGEFIAFVIGWNMILEYVIGTAGVANGYSEYIDALSNKYISKSLKRAIPMHVSGLSAYPDFLSMGITLLITAMLSVGVSESTRFNNICTGFNILVVLFVVICGAFKADPYNWRIPKSDIPHGVTKDGGSGGFMPFGFAGIMAGAAKCFFGFVGFDIVATTGEEVKNPKRAIPVSFVLSLIIIFVAYVSVATIQTLMQPYYLQDNGYALPYVFELSGYSVARWIISIGALAGLSTSLLGGMFPLPRVIYAMAKDGVIYRWLGKINSKTKTPLIATILSGILAAFMAGMFNLEELIDMMSIGTLMAYTLVSASVLLLRYKRDEEETELTEKFSIKEYLLQAFNRSETESGTTPTILSSRTSSWLVIGVGFFSIGASFIPALFLDHLAKGDWWAVLIFAVFATLLVLSVICLKLQPEQSAAVSFKVPLVPLIPSLGIFVNVYLMLSLSKQTWIRFAVWMVLGLFIYFTYGMFNSSQEYLRKGLVPPNQAGESDGQVNTNSPAINAKETGDKSSLANETQASYNTY